LLSSISTAFIPDNGRLSLNLHSPCFASSAHVVPGGLRRQC
jgi:hypothetical protein